MRPLVGSRFVGMNLTRNLLRSLLLLTAMAAISGFVGCTTDREVPRSASSGPAAEVPGAGPGDVIPSVGGGGNGGGVSGGGAGVGSGGQGGR